MKDKLKEALVFMVTEYCRHRKEGKDLLAVGDLENYTGFKLGLYYTQIFTEDELNNIENEIKAEWGYGKHEDAL